jgi:hypothetical protein
MRQQFAGGPVDGGQLADQTDGVGAAGRGPDVVEPGEHIRVDGRPPEGQVRGRGTGTEPAEPERRERWCGVKTDLTLA